jgi:integrase
MALTDIAIRKAKPQEKPVKLYDSAGLFLLLNPNGSRWWRFKYRFAGKEKLLSMGTYPEVSLKEAREKRDQARKQIAAGIDPGAERKAIKAATGDTFEAIAREWFAKFSPTWADTHAGKIIRRLELDVFPWIGARPVREITAPELLAVLRRIEERGALDTAHRAKQNCGQIFRYAIATGRADRDPSGDLRGALPPAKEGHFASITEPKAIGELLRALDGYRGSFVTRCALRLAPLVFVRPGELRGAEWAEFDLDGAEWRIPAERMKTREAHIVPLSTQAVAVLRELHPLTGAGRYVFPNPRTDTCPMSNNAVLAALRRMGYDKAEMTGHGFRVDIIEHQLAHTVKDPLGRAYNRTKHLDEWRRMMQAWADYLDELKQGATVLPFRRSG